jgi:hypothetical protein
LFIITAAVKIVTDFAHCDAGSADGAQGMPSPLGAKRETMATTIRIIFFPPAAVSSLLALQYVHPPLAAENPLDHERSDVYRLGVKFLPQQSHLISIYKHITGLLCKSGVCIRWLMTFSHVRTVAGMLRHVYVMSASFTGHQRTYNSMVTYSHSNNMGKLMTWYMSCRAPESAQEVCNEEKRV